MSVRLLQDAQFFATKFSKIAESVEVGEHLVKLAQEKKVNKSEILISTTKKSEEAAQTADVTSQETKTEKE